MPAMTDIDLSVRMCAAIRDAVGTKADLLFGTHGQFTTAGAIRLGVALEPYNPLWYEEPVPPDNIIPFVIIFLNPVFRQYLFLLVMNNISYYLDTIKKFLLDRY